MIAQKITYNIIFNSMAKIISIILALIAIGMLTRYLGPAGFGKYTTMLAFFAFFSAVGDFGLYAITTREISRENSNEQWILSRVFTLRLLLSIAIFISTTIFVWFLPYDNDVKFSILIAAAAFISASGYGLLNGLFQKYLAMDRVALVDLSGKIIQVAIIICVVKLHLGFTMVAISLLVTMLWDFIALFILSRFYTKITLVFDYQYWKKFLKESAPMGVSAIITFLYFKCDAILLSFMQTQSDVGIYGIAYKVIETLTFFPAMIVGLVFPLFSRYIFTEPQLFNKIVAVIIKLFMIILIPLIVSTVFLAPEIISIVGGDEFLNAVPLLQILIFALACIFFGQLFTNILIAGSQQKKLMHVLIFAATFNIIFNIIFIYYYSYFGAAIISVLTELFVVIATMYLARKHTTFHLQSIRLPYIILAGTLMIIPILTLSVNHFVTIAISVVLYMILLFIFQVITYNDIMHILPKRS